MGSSGRYLVFLCCCITHCTTYCVKFLFRGMFAYLPSDSVLLIFFKPSLLVFLLSFPRLFYRFFCSFWRVFLCPSIFTSIGSLVDSSLFSPLNWRDLPRLIDRTWFLISYSNLNRRLSSVSKEAKIYWWNFCIFLLKRKLSKKILIKLMLMKFT